MKFNQLKSSVLLYALLFGMISTLLTGCFFWRGDDRGGDRGYDHHEGDHHD